MVKRKFNQRYYQTTVRDKDGIKRTVYKLRPGASLKHKGRWDEARDKKLEAKKPGKRTVRKETKYAKGTNKLIRKKGNVYYETRRNRSDWNRKKKL